MVAQTATNTMYHFMALVPQLLKLCLIGVIQADVEVQCLVGVRDRGEMDSGGGISDGGGRRNRRSRSSNRGCRRIYRC